VKKTIHDEEQLWEEGIWPTRAKGKRSAATLWPIRKNGVLSIIQYIILTAKTAWNTGLRES
jgi:hypothetical protein